MALQSQEAEKGKSLVPKVDIGKITTGIARDESGDV